MVNGWKKSQSSSGYYKKYDYGFKQITKKHEPQNKIAGKWSAHYRDTGSGEGYLIFRGSLSEVNKEIKKFMRNN